MKTKQELLEELAKIEEQEELTKNIEVKKKNFENFMKRSPDFMVGKAHCEFNFINKRYASDRSQSVMPDCIQVSGNCGVTYRPIADITDSTRTYFHNVWKDSVKREFQKELNELAYKYADIVKTNLYSVLEMMGLQSLHYYVSEKHFTSEDLEIVKEEIKKSQFEILDEFKDEDFLNLLRTSIYTDDETGEKVESSYLDLSHSRRICTDYLKENRPELLKTLNIK